MQQQEICTMNANIGNCAVCDDKADGYHYGVLSCRGCNAFFRRAVTYNLQFNCRRGGNCIIDKNARCACRACRFSKCKSIGMDKSAVQVRHAQRDSNGSGTLLDHFIDIKTEPLPIVHNDSTPTSGQFMSSPNSAFSPFLSYTTNNGQPMVSTDATPFNPIIVFGSAAELAQRSRTYTFSLAGGPALSGYIGRLIERYIDQRSRRRSMLCKSLEHILAEDSAVYLCGPATPNDLIQTYRVQMTLMFEWVEKLEEFRAIISPQDKAHLLRAFSIKYLLMDNVFLTIEIGHTDRLVLANRSFVQMGNLPPLLVSAGSTESTEFLQTRQTLAMMYDETFLDVVDEVVRPMVEMNVTFGELVALRLILFWNPGDSSFVPSEQTAEVIRKASEKALQELHTWFEANGIAELKTRLENLLLLLSPLQKHAKFLKELTSKIPDFSMPDWDSFMNDLLL